MTTFFIGKILEIKYAEREDKATKKAIHSTQVVVMNDTWDEEGYYTPSIENIQLAEHQYDSLKDSIGKYIAVPYMFLSTKNGSYLFPNDAIAPIVMDKNPVDYTTYKRDSKKVS